MKIKDIINSTQTYGDKLKIQVNSSFEELQRSINTIPVTSIGKTSEPKDKTHALQYVAFGLAALGIIGWISTDTDAIWPKLSLGGGVVLFAYDLMKGRKKDSKEKKEFRENLSLPVSKQDIQRKIKDIIGGAIREWDTFTNTNKNTLKSLIEGSSASSDDKFVTTNTASLSRKIQFSLLPYVVKILSAETGEELDIVLCDIQDSLINVISSTVATQISDYKFIAEKINQE